MKAYLLHKTGGVENLVLSDIEKPIINPDEVLISAKAISINPVDVKVRSSKEVLAMIMQTEECPVILGWDIAGIVEAVGKEVREFAIGDKVFGLVQFPGQGNAYAEYVAAPARHLAIVPEAISYEEAAATTLAALTALQVFHNRLNKHDRILIHAGAGGVGHFAIQMAKAMGAYVVATSSAKNREFIMSLGADEHIDYNAHKFEEVLTNIDFVLDGVGGEVLERSLTVLKDGGKIVSLPTPQFSEMVQSEANRRNIALEFVLVQSNGKDMNTLKNMLEAKTLKPHVSKIVSFKNMADAHSYVESNRTVGKMVLVL